MAGIYQERTLILGKDENNNNVPIAVDEDGSLLVVITPPANPNKLEFAEDLDFTSGPATFNLNSLLGANGTEFKVSNIGVGDINVSYSSDGAAFSTPIRLECGGLIGDDAGDIHSVRIEHTGVDSAYQVFGK